MRTRNLSVIRSGASCCVAALVLLLSACGGNDGAAGPAGPPGSDGGNGTPVTGEATSLTVTDIAVTFPSPPAGPQPVVSFTVTNEQGTRYVGLALSNFRFTLAKLMPGTNGNPSAWQSYINKTETPPAPGAAPNDWPSTTPATQATYDNTGTFVSNGDGTYTYTFKNDVKNIATPIAVAWEPTLTHRLAIQISGGAPITNAIYDWRPSDGATTNLFEREIVQTASCNECHGKLAVHGGSRIETQYCVTCHNPGSTDANSGNTVDFKVMIHKIHRSENLPSVIGGTPYVIWGNSNSKNNFSDVTYPQDIRNCTKCHDVANAGTKQGDHWNTAPSREACGSCHDNVNFDTGANHTPNNVPEPDNSQCTVCHSDPNGFPGSPSLTHAIPAKAAGTKYAFNIISVTNTAPGQFPVITYEVTDPTNANARYDVRSTGPDPAWVNGSLSLLIGWNTADYTNVGNGSATTPASPVTLNGRAASSGNNAAPTKNADGTFTVTSLRAVDASAVGSATIGMYGRAAADFDNNGTFTDNVPITSVVEYVPITDASAVGRRHVVDIAKCDKCHDQLTLHGSARTDEPQLCAMCHNANNTDLSRRPACTSDGQGGCTNTADNLVERTVDFKVMVHAIHGAAKRTNPFVVYGFGGSINDFSTVTYPGVLNNCATCHASTSFTVPLKAGVLATTVNHGASIPDPTDDTNVTPTAAVCSSCHDTSVAQTHMEQNGASFVMTGDPGTYSETCEVCHGSGRIADVSVVHSVQ